MFVNVVIELVVYVLVGVLMIVVMSVVKLVCCISDVRLLVMVLCFVVFCIV